MAGIVSGFVTKINAKLNGRLAVKIMAIATAINICPGIGNMAQ
jgi:hypothetical protein